MTAVPFATPFAHSQYKRKYAWPGEEWKDTAHRVVDSVMGALYYAPGARDRADIRHELALRSDVLLGLVEDRRFIPGGRYLANAGRDYHQVNNCFLMRAEDSREGWASLAYKSAMALMSGGGIGVYYGDIREEGALIGRTGGTASGPVPLAKLVNDQGRAYVSGGNRRSAIWAGLLWSHPDIMTFIRSKDWPDWLREQKAKDPTVAAPLDMTNVSVCLDDEFFAAYDDVRHPLHARAREVYTKTVDKMITTGEPGFSVDVGASADEKLRNACTEVVSADDSDVCNLGSLVLPRFQTHQEFGRAVRDAVLFLTAGSLYSDVPYAQVADVRDRNRRLGLGIIGVHEFVMKHGARYGTAAAEELLEPYYQEYDRALEYANQWQDELRVSHSIAVRAEAPNGTIGIIAESTPSGDPLFSAAEERTIYIRNPDKDDMQRHYVVDPTAARLLDEGVPSSLIEDAHEIAYDYERRFAAQAYQQRHTDQAVSSTVNLPYPITDPDEQRIFRDTLIKWLPKLRGITAYPDGARNGQPRKPVPLEYALEHQETVLTVEDETCVGGACGV